MHCFKNFVDSQLEHKILKMNLSLRLFESLNNVRSSRNQIKYFFRINVIKIFKKVFRVRTKIQFLLIILNL